MPRLVVTINDTKALPRLRTAIRQLRGVETVTTVPDVNDNGSSIRNEIYQRIDSLSMLVDGWDGADSKAIGKQCIKRLRLAVAKATDRQLEGWCLFPDAHGNLYLDYTGKDTTAGVTMTDTQLVYFIKRANFVQKNGGVAFTTRNLLSILQRVNG